MGMVKEVIAGRSAALGKVVPSRIPEENSIQARTYQGIPGIEAVSGGKLFATWYGGGKGEGPDNYVILSVSSDCGRTWCEILNIAPPGLVRAYDPTLWVDPSGRLWWFWSQSFAPALWEVFDGKCGVWCVCCESPENENLVWTEPRRIADGIMLNKPVVRSNGDWLLPTALWFCGKEYILPEDMKYAFSNVTISRDAGKTFEFLGSADVPDRSFDEHQIVELRDGRLWMLVRCYGGIGESFSADGGRNWTPGKPALFGGPNSRFAIRRLRSGSLLLVNHAIPQALPGELGKPEMRKRTDLTAWLSSDDGKSWRGRMLIDNAMDVSYPDFTQDSSGRIWLVYDHARYTLGEIKLASFTEDDVAAGRLVTPGSFLDGLVSAIR